MYPWRACGAVFKPTALKKRVEVTHDALIETIEPVASVVGESRIAQSQNRFKELRVLHRRPPGRRLYHVRPEATPRVVGAKRRGLRRGWTRATLVR